MYAPGNPAEFRDAYWINLLGPLVFIAAFIHGCSANATENYRRLTEAEIKATVIGKEVTDDVHWADQYRVDGSWFSVSMGKQRSGTWRITEGKLCIEAGELEDASCAQVWVSGTKYQWRVDGDPVPFDVLIQTQQFRN